MELYQSAGDKKISAISPIRREPEQGEDDELLRHRSGWCLIWCKHSPLPPSLLPSLPLSLLFIAPWDLTQTARWGRELRKHFSVGRKINQFLRYVILTLISSSYPKFVTMIKPGEKRYVSCDVKMIWEVTGLTETLLPLTQIWHRPQLIRSRSSLGMKWHRITVLRIELSLQGHTYALPILLMKMPNNSSRRAMRGQVLRKHLTPHTIRHLWAWRKRSSLYQWKQD